MIYAFLIAGALAVGVALVVVDRRERRAPRVPLVEVLVHTKDDQSIRGVQLPSDDLPYLLLDDARWVKGDQQVDAGRVRIPRANEAWTQLVGS